MLNRRRRHSIPRLRWTVAAALLPICLQAVGAWQLPPPNQPDSNPKDDGSFTSNVKLPVDPRAKRKLEMAKQFIKSQDWTQAIKLLQSLLDTKEDVFLQEEGKNRRVSVRTEANRLLGALPKEGQQFYEQEYGVPARLLLRQGEATGDPQVFADVALRYLHTEAGAEAAALLGAYHLDQGQYITAALCFERLASRSGGFANLSPLNLYRAALAFSRSGDADDRDKALEALEAKLGQPGSPALPPALMKLSKSDLRASLVTAAGESRLARNQNWPMFLGSPDRIALGIGSVPYLEPRFGYPLDATKSLLDKSGTPEAARAWIDQALRKQVAMNYPVLPGNYPVAVGQLLVYRSAWGVHAVNVKTGELKWENSSKVSLVAMASPRSQDNSQYLNQFQYYREQFPWLFFENTLIGTLSTDQTLVYGVEDVALPPTAENQYQPFPGRMNRGNSQWYYQHNKLVAYDLESERGVVWEIGTADDKEAFADTFFLGSPLPLGDKLYCLAETAGEIRLLCLQNQRTWDAAANRAKYKVELAWAQPLCQPHAKLVEQPQRRTWTCQLAYSDGILVCPTNLGAIIGVDLLTRSLVWAHAYQQQDTAQANADPAVVAFPGMPGRRMAAMPMVMAGDFGTATFNKPPWSVSAPMIAGGLVVFVAPDSKYVHALSLKDGVEVWRQSLESKAKSSDLYLGGIVAGKVIIVGQNGTRALNLKDGKAAWNLPTGLPAGRGVASDQTYYLPVRTADTKNPEGGEVWAIDVAKGEVTSRSKSKSEALGNLIFHDGDLISQGPLKVTVYPQLAAKEEEITTRLKVNPKDPAGLAQRGEMRLYRGNLSAAVSDLRSALDLGGMEPAQRRRAREKLYDSLSELLDKDFAAHEADLAQLDKLTTIEPLGPESDEQKLKREEEQLDRRARVLRLTAKGRQSQGRVADALAAYLDFAELGGNLITSPDDSTLLVAPRLWAQGRVDEMLKKATPEQQQQLASAFAKAWSVARAGDLPKLRRFVEFYAPFCGEGKEAQLLLAEKLIAEKAYAEAGIWLGQAAMDPEPQRAARALDAYARLFTELGELDNAAYYYRTLADKYPKVSVRDGKTGEQLYQELTTDKRFLPYISGNDNPRRGLLGQAFQSIEMLEPRRMTSHSGNRAVIWLEPQGPVPPLFAAVRVGVDLTRRQVRLIDRDTDEERRVFPLQSQALAQTPFERLRGSYQALGQLLVFAWGNTVYAYDVVAGKLLWSQDLLAGHEFGGNTYSGYNAAQIIPQAGGRFMLVTMYNTKEWVGTLGVVTSNGVCFTMKDRGLVMVDPLTGKERWVRTDVPTSMDLFGDGETLFLVPPKLERKGRSSLAFRILDGALLSVPDFTRPFDRKLRQIGRHLLLKETDDKTDEVLLRLYDPLTGKDEWSLPLGKEGLVLTSQDCNVTGGVDPEGRLTVVDVRSGKPILRAKVNSKLLDDLVTEQPLQLLGDADSWYLFFNQRPPLKKPGQSFLERAPQQQMGSDLRTVNVLGPAFCFDRRTGALRWQAELPMQSIVVEQFDELPIIVGACMFQRRIVRPGAAVAQGFRYYSGTLALDKRTGTEVGKPFEQDNNPYLELRLDQPTGLIELVGQNSKVGWQLVGSQ